MKPLRLEIEGLTAFADRAVIDFTDLQLFAITGPTGAGKSTLIDAMLLALFGKVPRVANQYGQLIAHGKDQIAVLLEFAAGGERYRIARRIRRKGALQVQLERVTDAGPVPLAGKAREAEAMVEQILGIDYEAFTRSVVLPQGQFDEFLRGDKAHRRAILVNLLGLSHYGRMATLARERHGNLQHIADDAGRRLQTEFADATPAQLDARVQELAAAEQEQQRLTARQATLATVLEIAVDAEAARRALAQSQTARGATLRQHTEAATALQREQHGAETFATERQTLQEQVAAIAADPDRIAALGRALPLLPPLLRALRELPQLIAEATDAQARLRQVEQDLAKASASLPALAAGVARSHTEVGAAAAELERQRRTHAAMHLRTGLVPGAPCPVCAQPVAAVPRTEPTGIDERGRRHEAALEQWKVAEQLHRDARRQQSQLAAALPGLRELADSADQRRRRADAEIARTRDELRSAGVESKAQPTVDDADALRRELGRELAELRQRVEHRATLQRQLDDLIERHRANAESLSAARAKVSVLAEQLRERDADCEAAQSAAADADRKLAAAIADGGLAAGSDAGVGPPGPGQHARLQQLASATAATLQAHSRRTGQLAEQVTHLRAAIGQATALREQLEAAAADAALARNLALLLRGDHFQDFVLESAVQRLCRDGSARLLLLSGGRYSLRHDGSDFAVVDHWNADRERSVRTLSGGETFLASLALSLALAEGIRSFAARDGGASALECLFVDEGFGALDDQALEAAVQALEALHGGQRMVGVITHLEALADRLPVRIAVDNRAGRATVAVR